MSEGDSFGERSLLYDQVRAATIVAETRAHLLKIEKDDFKDLLKKVEKKQKEMILDFLKCNEFFNNITGAQLTKIALQMQLVNYKRAGTYVATEGEPVDKVVIIYSG